MRQRAYMDYNATAPLRPEARAAALAAFETVGNPSSVHAEGRAARMLVEGARADVAALAGVKPASVIFTSGGTEAARMAFHAAKTAQGVERLIVSAIEHDAILASAGASGLPVDIAPVDTQGRLDLAGLQALLASGGKTLVALMLANNETGILQPVAEATALAHEAGALLLCDAVQAAGKIAFDFDELGVDMMLLGGHKIGAPLGVGALVLRDGLPFAALAVGGGQEMRRRSGSENVSGIAGFGAAARAAMEGLDAFTALGRLRDELEARIFESAPDAVFFGKGVERLPNTSYLAAPGLDAATVLMALDLDGVAVSAGAACSSGKIGRARVLDAMGVADELSRGAVRVSLGWSSDAADIARFVESWLRIFRRVREKGAGEHMNVNVNASPAHAPGLVAVER
ncbi:MAG: cysteine desulfurase [Parvibaculum sp.]|nr:cysteine desulfurase [Parvibaculum sp.]